VRVLVVEDSARMGELLTRGLSEDGYAVDLATNATDGLWLAAEDRPDAIVLDVVLPDRDGFETCRALRDAGCTAPILMLTARDDVADRVRGLDAGADDYLTKPFAFAELLARVRALIRRGPSERPPVIRVGDLALDPASHRAWRGDVPLELTPKEFALLGYLMRFAGQARTRQQILEHVWDFAYSGDPNVVDVYVGYLRAKVDRPFGRRSIETVRGVGYRLADAGPREAA
jgi:two-component system OmpR family response regulator